METMVLWCVYDRVSGLYSYPLCAINKDVAERDFLSYASESPFVDDIELYIVGEFNQQTGEVVCYDKPFFVCKAFRPSNSEVNA